MKQKLAHAVRVVSIPPVMVSLLVLVLAAFAEGFFASKLECFAMLFFLAIIPLLAYPLSWVIPRVRGKGREGQRNLAFALTAAGYVFGWLYGVFLNGSREQILVYTIYLNSLLLLLLWNKVFRLRASGHGCSVTGPVVLAGYYLGLPGILVSAAVYLMIFWASVTTGRHKWDEFLGGSVLCFAACGISWLLCNYFVII